MRDVNPYKILQVSRNADLDTIEDAYDRLFDKYEPRAQAGDASAIRTLEALNEAHDLLVDPERRAEVDARLAQQAATQRTATATQTMEAPRPNPRTQSQTQAAGRPTSSKARQQAAPPPRGYSAASRRAAQAAQAAPARRTFPPIALISGGVLLLLIVILAVFLISRGSGPANTPVPTRVPAVQGFPTGTAAAVAMETEGIDLSTVPTPVSLGGSATSDPNKVVATVNGQPIYMRDYVVRVVKDEIIAQTDPMLGPLLATNDVTSTRMLDIIHQDSLDKLINMQVILQQSRKEGVYPSPDNVKGLVDQAKQHDLNGLTYEQFLQKNNLTDQQYQDNVVRNVVYALMASQHIPQTGTNDDKQNAFISWICETRKQYDVKVLLAFTQANQPCTSGLPSDVPLSDVPPDNGGSEPPQPEQTGVPGVTP